jgi:hypothetical protein
MKQLYTTSIALCLVAAGISQSTRTVLLEVSESTWTENNSSIICAKEKAKSSFSDDELAVISYHWDDLQNGGDPLFQTFADQWAQTFNVSVWGRGAIDRVSYNGTTMTSLSEDLWIDTITARINRTTDGLVTLPEVLYDSSYEEIFVRTNLLFTDSTYGIVNREMRFFLYLVQNGVSADQVVDATNFGNCTLFSPPFDTVNINGNDYLYKPNFNHNDVAVKNPTGVSGTDNIITQQIVVGNQFNDMVSFAKPAGADINNLRVVAFVANYDNADITKNELINAAQESTFTIYNKDDVNDPNHPENEDNPNSRFNPANWPTSIEEVQEIDLNMTISPNPLHDLGIISFTVPARSRVSVDVYDLNGRKVKSVYNQTLGAGSQKAAFNASEFENGVYFARIYSDSFVAQKSFVVAR